MNRRETLLSGAAVAALAMLPPWAKARGGRRPALTAVVHDRRYADSRAFAEALEAPGIESLSVQSGAVDLWRAHLGRVGGRPKLAGMTTWADFATLRLCAAELRMSVLHQCLHDCRGSSTLTHRIHSAEPGRVARALSEGGARWPRALATSLISASGGDAGEEVVAGLHRRAADHPGTLVSWLIG